MTTKQRTYSRFTRDAALLLAKLIQLGRKERRLSESELASRAGISRTTLQKIEKGDLKCEIGIVFEVAALVGVPLFASERSTLAMDLDRVADKLALLPKMIRKPTGKVHDEF